MNRQSKVSTAHTSTSEQCIPVPDTVPKLLANLGDPDSMLRSKIAGGYQAWRIMAKRNGASQPLSTKLASSYHGEDEMVNMMEYDRTTLGTKRDLQRPFSAREQPPPQEPLVANERTSALARSGRLPTPPDQKDESGGDPIEAELHPKNLSPPPSATGSASKCPIRFLDQHSPEEVARYFESHKHEIPRSHEICVKRYQSNEASIRQLDAKYGNLINMIQGLGVKHKPLLPQDVEQRSAVEEHHSVERVEAWAEEVDVTPTDVVEEQMLSTHPAEEREGRFDRELKEIRVGESPSRPWGISIPYPEGLALSMTPTRENGDRDLHSMSDDRCNPCSDQMRPAGSCPFNRGASQAAKDLPLPKRSKFATESITHGVNTVNQTSQPQMLFTGPVFIGYPPEQMAMLLREHGPGTEKQ